jgi:hypothetical protein
VTRINLSGYEDLDERNHKIVPLRETIEDLVYYR